MKVTANLAALALYNVIKISKITSYLACEIPDFNAIRAAAEFSTEYLQ